MMETPNIDSTGGGPSACATRLCDRCRGVSFDDSGYGGFIAISENGKEFLQFSELSTDEEARRMGLAADFELTDWLPTLALLDATHCDFCGFL
jgi:hypothetical protein